MTISIDIDVECDECGKDLEAERVEGQDERLRIFIKPCEDLTHR